MGRNADTVAYLLEHGDPNARDDEGKTPMHVAAFKGHTGVIEHLLLGKADPTLRTDYGQSPLDIAVRKKFDRTADILQTALGSRL